MPTYKLKEDGEYFRLGVNTPNIKSRIKFGNPVTYSKLEWKYRDDMGFNGGVVFLNCKLLYSKLLRTIYE